MITIAPKEKAKELVEKYAIWSWNETYCDYNMAKELALIAVRFAKGNVFAGGYNDYLDQVEQEINNL